MPFRNKCKAKWVERQAKRKRQIYSRVELSPQIYYCKELRLRLVVLNSMYHQEGIYKIDKFKLT